MAAVASSPFERAKQSRDVWRLNAAAYREAIARIYPVGSIVEVTLGRARVTLKVTGHSDYDSGTVHGVNVETGKSRKFYAGFHDAEFVEKAGC